MPLVWFWEGRKEKKNKGKKKKTTTLSSVIKEKLMVNPSFPLDIPNV